MASKTSLVYDHIIINFILFFVPIIIIEMLYNVFMFNNLSRDVCLQSTEDKEQNHCRMESTYLSLT